MAASNKSKSNSARLDSKRVLEFVKKHKKFSTEQVQDAFKVRFLQAVAAINILIIKEVVERGTAPSESNPDQSSRWVYIG